MILATTVTISTSKLAYANPLTDREEFDVVVINITQDILVSVTINGKAETFLIKGNPHYISAPTVQSITFTFARHLDANPPTPFPIKLGDVWVACIKYRDTQSSCEGLPILSLTQPQDR